MRLSTAILAVCLGSVLGGGVQAGALQDQVDSQIKAKPYLQVKTVQSDSRRVRVFFSPHCPFSADYLGFFHNLETTLPRQASFIYSPVVNRMDGAEYALAFLAVQRYYPKYVNNFVEASMLAVEGHNYSSKNWAVLNQIGVAAHVPQPISVLVYKNSGVLKQDVVALAKLQAQLKITNTPSVAVAGTFVVTPEITNGDTAQFSQLVNAVISMAFF